jgi:3-oxoacyl-[acyl-carrier-protein] synthase-3
MSRPSPSAPDPPDPEPRAASLHRSRIESLGLELPATRLSTAELLASCRRSFRVDLEGLTGIRERRVCRDGEDSFSLAIDAAWDCLAHSRHQARDIEVLISCSITKFRGRESYRFEPPLSLAVKEAIGASQALHFDVTNACAGMLTGVSILNEFIRAGSVRCGMVVSGEFISSISDNAARRVRSLLSPELASLTVGDAGSAVILERAENGAPGISACELTTHARWNRLCIGRSCPDGPGASMKTRPRKLHDVAIRAATPVIERALERSGLASFGEIDLAIPHQTSVRAIRAGTKHAIRELGSTPQQIVYNVERYGNTASTTLFLALYRSLEEGRLRAGQRVMLVGYASGVVVGALVFTVDELVERYGRLD